MNYTNQATFNPGVQFLNAISCFKHFSFLISILVLMITTFQLEGQVRNLYVEGIQDQYGVIRTTDIGDSKSGIELLRGSEFSGTDWRMQNNAGTLQFSDGTNNFTSAGDLNMTISTNGSVNIFNGSDGEADDNSTGTLILGDPNSFHIALDNNGIIARNDESGSRLLLQTGLDKGDTYLNNLSGNVGIGTTAPKTKLGVEDSGFQLRIASTTQLSNEWYIGASHESWTVGGNRFVISPSSSSGNAMLVLNQDDNTISARSNRIISVDDPINDRDAVNLRTLNESSFLAPKQISTSTLNQTFSSCASVCRNKDESGFTDWTVPSIEQASHFIGTTGSSQFIWTSDVEMISYAHLGSDPNAIVIPRVYESRLMIDLNNGAVNSTSSTNILTATSRCRCVR